MRKLIVTRSFGDYEIGAEITEAADITKIEASHPGHVVAVNVKPPPPEPAAPTPKDPAKS